jgi:cell division protein FtsW
MKLFGTPTSERFSRPQRRVSRYGASDSSPARKHRPDYTLFAICLGLLGIGLIVVYSISPGLAAANNVDDNYYVTKQLIAIGLGIMAFLTFASLPLKFIKSLTLPLVIAAAISVVLVQVIGDKVNGAARWIQVGGLSFQVAELIKLALIVWLAAFLVERVWHGEVKSDSKTLRPLLIVLGLIGLFVAILESDLGSTGVMVAIIGLMAFTVGLPLKKIAIIAGIIIIGTLLAISTSSYRRDRVATFLNPASDCQTTGYQSCQALIAVGSGGMFGLGLGKSVQAFGYLPEAANDSIFAVLAEKFGFVGVSLVLAIYLWLFSRLRRIIMRTSDLFSRLIVVGVLAWLSTQTIINVGAMIGLLPLKGITLPFISYGGTSLIFAMAAIGVVFQISRFTSFAPIRNTSVEGESGYDDPTRGRGQRRTYRTPAGGR